MKTISDEELNEYIDDNLTNGELEKLNERLLSDSDALEKLKGLKSVNIILTNLTSESAPENTSQNVMQSIRGKREVSLNNKNYFFRGIVFLFVTSILFFGGYAAYLSKGLKSNSISLAFFKNISVVLDKYMSIISSHLYSSTSMLVFGTLSLILMIAFYFIITSHNAFLKKINNFV